MNEIRSIREREQLLRETLRAQLERLNYEQLHRVYLMIRVMER